MRRFLYYFPKRPGVGRAFLQESGVLDRFPGEYIVAPVANGPAGPGCVVCVGAQPPRVDPVNQQWIEGEKYWVGIEGEKPTPADLMRESHITGRYVTLADGNNWLAPVIHAWDANQKRHVRNIPTAMSPCVVDGKAAVKTVVVLEYRAVDKIAEELFLAFANESVIREADYPLMFTNASSILSINYRVGALELGLVGALDIMKAVDIFKICIDVAGIEAHASMLASQGVGYSEPQVEME